MPGHGNSAHFTFSQGTAMDQHFQSLPISIRDARNAYALIYLHDASISMAEWLNFVRRRCGRPSGRTGIMAVSDRRGITHAIFVYRVDIDMRARKRLCLNNLVVARIPGSTIDSAILASANVLAARHACKTISLEQPFGRRSGISAGCPTATNLLANHVSSIPTARRH